MDDTNNPTELKTDSAAFDAKKIAKMFKLNPADVFACREYPDRWVVVTADGRKLALAKAE